MGHDRPGRFRHTVGHWWHYLCGRPERFLNHLRRRFRRAGWRSFFGQRPGHRLFHHRRRLGHDLRIRFALRALAANHRPHTQYWMAHLVHPILQLFHGGDLVAIRNAIDQVGDTFALGHMLQLVGHGLFDDLAHPHHALEAAVSRDELGANQVILAHAHYAGCLHPTTGHAGQGAKLHPGRGLPRILPAHHHHPLHLRNIHHNTLKTATGRHRVLHDRVHGNLFHHPMRALLGIINRPLPVPHIPIQQLTQLDRLVRASWINAKARFAVQPVIRPTQAQPFRADNTNVIRRKALAQRARIKLIHRRIR